MPSQLTLEERKRARDRFFRKQACDRCGGPLHIRVLSWFLDDVVICAACCRQEHELRKKLKEQGDETDYEGCGYIPQLENKEDGNGLTD
jgi:hypothetical protein